MQQSPHQSSLSHFAPHLGSTPDGDIPVRAIQKGFYNNTLRVPGESTERFGIASMDEFSDKWMELVTDDDVSAASSAPASEAPKSKAPKSKAGKSENDVL